MIVYNNFTTYKQQQKIQYMRFYLLHGKEIYRYAIGNFKMNNTRIPKVTWRNKTVYKNHIICNFCNDSCFGDENHVVSIDIRMPEWLNKSNKTISLLFLTNRKRWKKNPVVDQKFCVDCLISLRELCLFYLNPNVYTILSFIF